MSGVLKSLVEPPVNDAPIVEYDAGQQHSRAWTDYFQSVTDQVNRLVAKVTGVTDGSDAAAGQVGEFMTASGTVSLTNNVTASVASMTLTAGDWHVWGFVTFTLTSATSNHYAVGIDGTLTTNILATIPSGSGSWGLPTAMVRLNLTTSSLVHVDALAGFSAGTVSATGTINARRMR
jgi:hypothetical protein